MNAADFIKRLLDRSRGCDLPPLEAAEDAARHADMPWLSDAAFAEFSGIQEVHGGAARAPAPRLIQKLRA